MRAILIASCAAAIGCGPALAQVDTVLPEDEAAASSAAVSSASGRSYPDGLGGDVFFPRGDSSFADDVTSFETGEPAATLATARDPIGALGPPDYDEAIDGGYTTLGCGGVLVVQFDDNVLVDVDGDDLYVFEIGEAVEGTRLSISADGLEWVEIGAIGGATASVDIAEFVDPDSAYRFVRLEDAGDACGPSWPGADIDAVGAIGSGQRILLEGAVLFGFDQAILRDDAVDALRSVHAAIMAQDNPRVIIEGYTDDRGPAEYNLDLSQRRADAVRRHLEGLSTRARDDYVSVGHGEERPIAPNDTEDGRAENRRVEILILSPQTVN